MWLLELAPFLFVSSSIILCFSALEDVKPDDAIQLYTDACEILEEDGRDQMAFDLYRACANVYIKLEK